MNNHHQAGFKMIIRILFLSAMLALSGCSKEGVEETAGQQIALPPSLSDQRETNEGPLVRLSEKQAGELNVKSVPVKKDNFVYPISVPGMVFPAPDHISVISAPINGLVVAIHAHEGDYVRKGEVLVELESLEFANLVAEYLQANAEATYQHNQFERLKLLVQKKIRSQRDLEKGEADYIRARAAAQAANSRLLAVGVTERQLEQWDSGQEAHPHLKILSPLDGVITEHLIDMGQAVNAYQRLGTVINIRKVLVKGYVSPEDGAILMPGDPVKISQREFPDVMIESQIHTVIPTLDELNKSITVNVMAEVSDHWPRPGQNARMTIFATTPEPVISIPVAAVEYEADQAAVFLKRDAHTYEKRFIRIHKVTDQNVVVAAGLSGGEEVAVTQVFSLKALARFDEFAEE